jgi:hypothetical protein
LSAAHPLRFGTAALADRTDSFPCERVSTNSCSAPIAPASLGSAGSVDTKAGEPRAARGRAIIRREIQRLALRCTMINRTQALVLAFFVVVLVSVIAIRVAAPDVYDQAFRLPPGDRRLQTIFLTALVAFIALLAIAVFRRWRWTFWLITAAFLAGVLRVPVVILQLTGSLAADTPTWYLVFQGVLGVVQFAIGVAMVAGYRRAGVWGAFKTHPTPRKRRRHRP